ncbi:hypothetical protein EVAR_103598_1 [Eumeta japonica]|uniref:Uncharacterized protein n=1 Tax=Eumeta variegata TaxID=151549 RepID=A0A4C1Z9C4_EUMVA|nr:hypothetical protein EVAR_103598_1 [Eumeta japonica]
MSGRNEESEMAVRRRDTSRCKQGKSATDFKQYGRPADGAAPARAARLRNKISMVIAGPPAPNNLIRRAGPGWLYFKLQTLCKTIPKKKIVRGRTDAGLMFAPEYVLCVLQDKACEISRREFVK